MKSISDPCEMRSGAGLGLVVRVSETHISTLAWRNETSCKRDEDGGLEMEIDGISPTRCNSRRSCIIATRNSRLFLHVRLIAVSTFTCATIFQANDSCPYHACSFNLSSISSKSSALSISIMRFTSAVLRMSSFAPAYSILTSALQVIGR